MSLRIPTLSIAALLSFGVFTGAQSQAPLENSQESGVKTVFPVKDIWSGHLIDENQVEERTLSGQEITKIQIPSDHLTSVAEVVGKVARRDLCCGTIICREQITPLTPPKPGEDWLLRYSDTELSKCVGSRIALKGFLTDWIIGGEHKDNECAILSCDGLTYVQIGIPCGLSKLEVSASEQRASSARRASWAKKPGIHSVVIARGVLHRCKTSPTRAGSSRQYFMFDQSTLTITKSSWCK